MQVLYEKPVRVELRDRELFVNGSRHERDVRRLSEMKDVLRSYVVMETSGDREIYYMFRNVYSRDGIRFDITLIPGGTLEGECVKTYGHSHPIAEDGLSYPEVYQVLRGSATFLLQMTNRDRSVSVSLISAEAGDVVLIPPNMAHVTINPGADDLVLANVVADGFDSDYSDFRKNRGAAVFCLPGGGIEQNGNYVVKGIERLRREEFNRRYGFACPGLLETLYSEPEHFAFLKKPGLLFRAPPRYQ
jgi:glucose-6-phosphate isomerase